MTKLDMQPAQVGDRSVQHDVVPMAGEVIQRLLTLAKCVREHDGSSVFGERSVDEGIELPDQRIIGRKYVARFAESFRVRRRFMA